MNQGPSALLHVQLICLFVVCDDGLQCVHQYFICNGKAQCVDGSDESEALCSPPCSADMFACASGLKCVSKKVICDFAGYDHCGDNSDESESLCTPPCSNVRLR